MTPGGHAAVLSDFLVQCRSTALPESVVHHARRALVDHMGVTLAGSTDPVSATARRVVAAVDSSTAATVLGTPMRTSAPFAAFLNAYAAHVLDLDDVYNPPGTTVHGSCSVWPAIFAMAHLIPVTGSTALTSFVLGFEVETRIAHAAGQSHYDAGWHVTGTSGHVGAAAAAASVAGLDATGMRHCLGAGATQAAGLRAMAGSDLKGLHPGKAAQDGVMSALLAQAGLTAGSDTIDGSYGYLDVMSDAPAPERLTEALGETWNLEANGHKLYPSGSLTHPMIDGVVALATEADLHPSQVVTVEALVSGPAARFTDVRDPANGMQAKFSLTHSAAAALIFRRLGLAELEEQVLRDAGVMALRERVSIVMDPTLGKQDAVVDIVLDDGRRLTREVRGNRGTPAAPLTDDELDQKFHSLVGPGFGSEASERILALCWRVDQLDDLTELAASSSGALSV